MNCSFRVFILCAQAFLFNVSAASSLPTISSDLRALNEIARHGRGAEAVKDGPTRVSVSSECSSRSLAARVMVADREESKPADLPESAVIDKALGSPASQGDLGSCTAWAVCNALEALTGVKYSATELYMYMKTMGSEKYVARSAVGKSGRLEPHEAVRLDLYALRLKGNMGGVVREENFFSYSDYLRYVNIRRKMWEGGRIKPENVLTLSQCYLKSIEELESWCVRSKKVVPKSWHASCDPLVFGNRFKYDERIFLDTFSMKAIRYGDLDELIDQMKTTLYNGKPIALSVAMFDKKINEYLVDWWIYSGWIRDDYFIDVPSADCEQEGGHAVCVCGYDDEKKAFKVKNSWGPSWGDSGFAWLSYNYVRAFQKGVYVMDLIRINHKRITRADYSDSCCVM